MDTRFGVLVLMTAALVLAAMLMHAARRKGPGHRQFVTFIDPDALPAPEPAPDDPTEWLIGAQGYATARSLQAGGATMLLYFYTDW